MRIDVDFYFERHSFEILPFICVTPKDKDIEFGWLCFILTIKFN